MPVEVNWVGQSDSRSIRRRRDASDVSGGGYDNVYWWRLATITVDNLSH